MWTVDGLLLCAPLLSLSKGAKGIKKEDGDTEDKEEGDCNKLGNEPKSSK